MLRYDFSVTKSMTCVGMCSAVTTACGIATVVERAEVLPLGKLVTKIDKKRTKTAPNFCHLLPYNSVFVNFDKNRQKLDFVASILSNLTKSDKTIIVVTSHHKKHCAIRIKVFSVTYFPRVQALMSADKSVSLNFGIPAAVLRADHFLFPSGVWERWHVFAAA